MCKWFLNFGSCNFGDGCYFDHGKILEKMELKKRIEVLEKMCSELHNKCERVLEESKTVSAENVILKKESLSLKSCLETVKNDRQIISVVPIDNDNHVQKIALQKTSVDSDEVKKYEQQTEKENINFLDKEIKDTWKFVMTERMTSNGIQQSKEKIKNIRGRIEKLNPICGGVENIC